MKKVNIISAMLLAAVFAVSCSNKTEDKPQAKNVIYLIGDGMGMGADGRGRKISKGAGPETVLLFDYLKVSGDLKLPLFSGM